MSKKINILSIVFQRIEEMVIEKCNNLLPVNTPLEGGLGAGKYGFSNYSKSKNTIKGLMISEKDVKNYVVSYCKENYESGKYRNFRRKWKSNDNFAENIINGKYFYDRCYEYGKVQTVKLTGIYQKLYFIFIGYEDIYQFLEGELHKEKLSKTIVDSQLSLLKASTTSKHLSNITAKFIGYYYSYRDHIVKKFILDIDYVTGKAEQIGFHYRQTDILLENKSINEVYLPENTRHTGSVTPVDQGLALTLNGENSSLMNILLYLPGKNIQDMVLVRGHLSTISAHSYIFAGEVFLRREYEKLPKSYMASPAYDHEKGRYDEIKAIKNYLFLQRRTAYIPPKLIENINEIRVNKKMPSLLDPFVGTWKIWGLDRLNRIVQSKLYVDENYNGVLSIYSNIESDSREPIEEQVCIFRIADDNDGHSLWISAHQEEGIQLRNVAVVKLPKTKKENVLEGASINIGVQRIDYGFSNLVFIRILEKEQQKFHPKVLEQQDLFTALFDTHKSSTQDHKKGYHILEKVVYPENGDEVRENQILLYGKLLQAFEKFIENRDTI